jgi:hypothetical protein
MSTPATAALEGSGASSPAGGAAVVPGGAGGGGAGPAGGGAGNGQPEGFWKNWTAPEQKETRDWIANKNYADPFTLAKTAQGLEKEAATLRSAVSLKGYPTDKVDPATGVVTKADENSVKAWRATMGVPETADKYEIPIPSANPYPQFAQFLKEGLLDANVPAAMAPRLAQAYEAAVTKMETQLRAQEDSTSKAALLELERAWGPNYQERVALAGRGKEWLAKEVGGLNDMQLRSLEAILGTDKFMSAMWKFGAGNKEPSFAGSGASPSTFGNNASAAQSELDQITADRSAGKINDFQWREKSAKRVDELVQILSAGMAPHQ